MTFLIYFISITIIISKFFDCYTTFSQITNINQERNPLARKTMKKFGIHKTIWVVFVLSIFIVIISVWMLQAFFDNLFYKILFIALGTIISIFQFAVAYTNQTKRLNIFTKLLLKKYGNC
ncbi:MAG TPA: hypothetical protein PKZ43_08660 [Bacteroidales bacterium]|nr:hypothetical protein [Bacteroidales bacterium]